MIMYRLGCNDGIHSKSRAILKGKGILSALYLLSEDPAISFSLKASTLTIAQRMSFLLFAAILFAFAFFEVNLIVHSNLLSIEYEGNTEGRA